MKIRFLIIFSVLCIALQFWSAIAVEASEYAIRAGKILTMMPVEGAGDGILVIDHGVILISDGKIEAVGTASEIQIPEGYVLIDASDRWAAPGIVEAHSHVGTEGGFNDMVTPINPELRIAAWADVGVGPFGNVNKIADSLDPFHYNVSFALAAGITTAWVVRGGGNPLGRINAVIKMTYGDLDNMLIKEPAAETVNMSNYQWLNKTNFLLNLRKAQTYLRKLAEYQKIKDKDKKAKEPKKPSDIDAYIRLLRREVPARVAPSTADDILAALEIVDEFGIRMILDSSVEAWTVAEEIAKRDVSLVITPRAKQRPNEDISAPSGSSLENAAILKKAGVKFAIIPPDTYFTTGGRAGRDLMTLPMDAAFAVQGGLDEQTALEAITINAAEILGVADRVGSLQVGKDADIIILDGHPFHHNTFVELTLVNGKTLYDKKKSTYFSHITHDE